MIINACGCVVIGLNTCERVVVDLYSCREHF